MSASASGGSDASHGSSNGSEAPGGGALAELTTASESETPPHGRPSSILLLLLRVLSRLQRALPNVSDDTPFLYRKYLTCQHTVLPA